MDAQQIIADYGLEQNPYGGWYRQIYSATTCLRERPVATAIHYLLTAGNASCMPHRTSADCIHYFHDGGAIGIRTVDPDGNSQQFLLGRDSASGQALQIVVPGGHWKEFRLLEGDFGLISEAVVPGYAATDDEAADPDDFHSRYPVDWIMPQSPPQGGNSRPLIAALELERNIEGGYYRQTYESASQIQTAYGLRTLANTIYYLLMADSPIGHFHVNHSDITHFFHSGGPIEYLLISPDGALQKVIMGMNHARGEVLSFTCPGGWWKSSHLVEGSSEGLISEITTPGFCYEDHKMADLDEFALRFPLLLDVCRDYIAQ